MKFVKQSNGNVVITDNSGNIIKRLDVSSYLQWMSSNTLEIQGAITITISTDDVVSTQVEPSAAIPFSGTAYDLMSTLTTDFFFKIKSGVGYSGTAQVYLDKVKYAISSYNTAITKVVESFKAANVWSKMRAVYPLLTDGISDTRLNQIKWNLVDPRDDDAAYRLTLNGGYTLTGSGILFNGINGYANTHFAPSLLGQNSLHMSVYSLTNTQSTVNDIGSIDNPITSGAVMLTRDAGNSFSARVNQSTANSVANATSLGFYAINRTGANVVNAWRNTTKIINQTTVSAAPNNFDIYLGARNDAGNATLFSNREYCFATIGEGLTDDEMGNVATIVQTFVAETGKVVYRYV
jgi:hypothetical protein